MKELPRYPLIVPERAHAMRRLLETQAALAGIKLDIAWEVSSIPSIIDLVCTGHGHAVLTANGVAASARASELAVRPLVDPTPLCVLCLVRPSNKRPAPLARQFLPLLTTLVQELPA
jgi:LysR family nitrogen assimilation transcriptional regulator